MLGEDWQRWATRCATPRRRAVSPFRCPPIPKSASPCFRAARWNSEIREFAPDAVHIATEGTLGLTRARASASSTASPSPPPSTPAFPNMCMRAFPWFRKNWSSAGCAGSIGPATAMMVATQTLKRELAEHGFSNLRIWSRGVDVENSTPLPARACPIKDRSGSMSAASRSRRTSRRFWRSTCPAPRWWWATARPGARWRAKYPDAKFLGALSGEALVRGLCGQRRLRLSQPHRHLRPGDTGGAGLRAYRGRLSGGGPPGRGGPNPWRLRCGGAGRGPREACLKALELARKPQGLTPRAFAESHSWRACTLQFLGNIAVEPDLDQPGPNKGLIRPPDGFIATAAPGLEANLEQARYPQSILMTQRPPDGPRICVFRPGGCCSGRAL